MESMEEHYSACGVVLQCMVDPVLQKSPLRAPQLNSCSNYMYIMYMIKIIVVSCTLYTCNLSMHMIYNVQD